MRGETKGPSDDRVAATSIVSLVQGRRIAGDFQRRHFRDQALIPPSCSAIAR